LIIIIIIIIVIIMIYCLRCYRNSRYVFRARQSVAARTVMARSQYYIEPKHRDVGLWRFLTTISAVARKHLSKLFM